MEESQTHRLELTDRKMGTLTGVVDVVSFDSNQILLETTQGNLIIKGKELHVSRLHLEQGEIDLDGMVDSMVYTSLGIRGKQKEGSRWKRLFQ
ncbi:MAG: sporulation protein YabP [Ruminococcus sp.]|nr:sporulation protein YabP [Ruminococcus sp.]